MRSVPPAWRERLLEELTDHLSDLKEEADMETLAEDRLGSPETIAAAAATEYRKLGFFARRPVLTYWIGPLVLVPVTVLLVLFLTSIVLGVMLEAGLWALGVQPSDVDVAMDNAMAQALVFPMRFLPFALAAWFFCRVARRHGRGWQSVLPACGIVAAYALIYTVTLTAKTAEQPGLLMIGLGLSPSTWWLNFLQAAVPLVIAYLFLRSADTTRPQLQSAFANSVTGFGHP